MSTLFILLLLCAMCVVPVMAGTRIEIIEDGVHLLKSDDASTVLNPQIYRRLIDEEFVVDGDTSYWVRIGNVKAKGLTTVWWAKPLAATTLLIIGLIGVSCWYLAFKRYLPEYYTATIRPVDPAKRKKALKAFIAFFIPVMCIFGATVIDNTASNALTDIINHSSCEDYANIISSDGTILLKVDKIHPEKNTLYAKSGLNIYAMNHIPSSGNNMQIHGGNLTGLKITTMEQVVFD
jgi:hypothetical protein